MEKANDFFLLISSCGLGVSVLLGLWTLFGLPKNNDTVHDGLPDYGEFRHIKLRASNSVFRNFYNLVMEWTSFSQRSSKLDLVKRDLPMGEKGNPWTAEEYIALATAEGFLLSMIAGMFFWIFVHPIVGAVIAPLVYLLYEPVRLRMLYDAADKRRLKIRQRLPLMIDLLSLSQGAGASFQGSLKTAVRETHGHPISEEFAEVLRTIELGRPIRTALDDLAQRVADAPIDEMVFAINKAMELGVPVADSLAEIADQMRLKVQQWGEKAASEAQVKIIFPSMIIMLACMIVIIAPFILPAIFGHEM